MRISSPAARSRSTAANTCIDRSGGPDRGPPAPGACAILFSEPLFLFAFLPGAFAAFALAGRTPALRLTILLLASLGFYAWGEPAFVPVVLASATLDYWLAQRITRGHAWALPVGVTLNLALLVFYKYLGFLGGLGGAALARHLPQIGLPIGVSFIVFEKITYLVDVARRRSQPAASLAHYLGYVLFFPKLLAGPIIRYHDVEAPFRAPPGPRPGMVTDGFARFMLGLIKKILLADIVAKGADAAFALPPGAAGFQAAWSGVALFTLQIYLDFSAYSDMAIGLARMFGFTLAENFNQPYTACSVSDFWRRWHMSLTGWIREYLYVPLGGNRRGALRTTLNLWICFLLSGLWHGAAWTFVLWGAYHGALLSLERLFLRRWLDGLPRLAANAVTLLLLMLGWTIFRAQSLAQLGDFLSAMAQPFRAGIPVEWPTDMTLAAVLGTAVSLGGRLPRMDAVLRWVRTASVPRFGVESAGLALFVLAVSIAMAEPFRPFLYFRF